MAMQLQLGYHPVTVNIGFVDQKNYKNRMKIYDYDHQRARVPINVCCYSDSEKLERDFDFHKNGFKFCRLEKGNPLSRAIEAYIKNPGSILAKDGPRFELLEFLRSWGPKNGIQGVPFLKSEAFYRSSHPNACLPRPVHFAHVDFERNRLVDASTSEGSAHQDMVKYEFSTYTDESYKDLMDRDSTTWFNVWIPLNKEPSYSTLAVMDTSSVPDLAQKLQPITFDNSITSFGLFPDPNQKWVMKEDLTSKDGVIIIFNSIKTPHSGVEDEKKRYQGHRESLELRGVFVTPPEKK